jgi:hypothetical protein
MTHSLYVLLFSMSIAGLPPEKNGFPEIRITNFANKNYCNNVSYRRLGLSFERELSSLKHLRNEI